MTHKLTLQSITPVTHDVNRLVFDKPAGFTYTPGQAVDFALDRDGWRDEERPFTFTSLPDEEYLEFTIKSYPSHDGVTEQIAQLQPGDTVLIGDPWGAIQDQGAGIFIAGGAGITPFIAILRQRAKRQDALNGCTLIFSNKCERDIILREVWQEMEGLSCVFTLTDEDAEGIAHGRVDGDFLDARLKGWRDNFYVCGPPAMVEDVTAHLKKRGVPDGCIVIEEA